MPGKNGPFIFPCPPYPPSCRPMTNGQTHQESTNIPVIRVDRHHLAFLCANDKLVAELAIEFGILYAPSDRLESMLVAL